VRKWYPVAVVLVALAASAAVYGRLPEQVPVHWNAAGEVDRYGSRFEGALLLPLVIAGIALLIPLLPRIDPRGDNYEKFRPTYHLVLNAVLTFMLGIHLLVLATALGARLPIGRIIPFGVGALFALLGNVLPRARPNWMFGIRTPWTLSNERVWERTHRVGGRLMVVAGVVTMIAALVAPTAMAPVVLIVAVLGASLGAMGYSFVAWRQEGRS
jgi:uncharacterized membrane protein